MLASVTAGWVSLSIEGLPELGVTMDDLIDRVGIERRLLTHADARIPARASQMLWQLISERVGDPRLIFELVARRVRPDTLGIAGVIGQTCDSVGAALAAIVHFDRLIKSDGVVSARATDAGQLMILAPSQEDPPWPPLLALCAVATGVQLTRRYSGQLVAPRQVLLRHEALVPGAAYEQFFQAPVRFGAGVDGFELTSDALALPVTSHGELRTYLESLATAWLRGLSSPSDLLLEEVAAVIGELLASQQVSLEQVAARIGMGTRTLQRRLRAASSSFQELVDQARCTRAKELLREPELSVRDIASQLGFANHGAFRRAFRRWVGQPPSVFRTSEHLHPDELAP